jgi:hypothetical protein
MHTGPILCEANSNGTPNPNQCYRPSAADNLNITISGSNTGNSPTTLISFSHLGGLVFQKSGANGKVVIDAGAEFISEWTFPGKADIRGAMSDDDGVSNTNAIVVNSACTNQTGNCAAYCCRTISADWYLPAKNELQAVIVTLKVMR